MKKVIFLALLALILISNTVLARFDQTHELLRDIITGDELTNFSLTSGTAVHSATIDTQHNAGFAALLITEDKSGGQGDVDVSLQYSIDGVNWYDPYSTTIDTSGFGGNIKKEDNIVTGLQNVTRWIIYTPRVGKFLRYKFDPDADSQITATHIFISDDK